MVNAAPPLSILQNIAVDSSEPAVAEGWYATAERPGFVRYWDGERWGDEEFPATPEIKRLMRDAADAGKEENNAGIFGFITVLVAIAVTVLFPPTLVVDPLLGLLAVGFGIVGLVRSRTRKHAAMWPALVAIIAGGVIAVSTGVVGLVAVIVLAGQ